MAQRRRKPGPRNVSKAAAHAAVVRRAAAWPVLEVLVSRGWNQPTSLASVLVARRSANTGQVAVAIFLVDLACLGVKNALCAVFDDEDEYTIALRERYLEREAMTPADIGLAAKIVATGLVYADSLGFGPHPDFYSAEHLLADADFETCPTPIPTGGPQGKPLFVAGPDDDAAAVIAHLTRLLDRDGFDFVAGLPEEELAALGLEDARRIEP
jgi:hypothetical protein